MQVWPPKLLEVVGAFLVKHIPWGSRARCTEWTPFYKGADKGPSTPQQTRSSHRHIHERTSRAPSRLQPISSLHHLPLLHLHLGKPPRKTCNRYFLSDNTISIEEPRVTNSGLSQGKFMRRLQVTRPLNARARDARSAGGSATPVRPTGGGGGDSEGGVIGAGQG